MASSHTLFKSPKFKGETNSEAETLYEISIPCVMSKDELPSIWELDNESRRLFSIGRPGQGYCGVAVVTNEKVKIYIRPAFNSDNGLVMRDRYNNLYHQHDIVVGPGGFGLRSAGTIHVIMRQKIEKLEGLKHKALEKSCFGFGVLKGIDHTVEEDLLPLYEIFHFKADHKSNIKITLHTIEQEFSRRKIETKKVRFVIIADTDEQEKKNIYLLLHGRLMKTPDMNKEQTLILNSESIAEILNVNEVTQNFIQNVLKLFHLTQPIYQIRNKSASLNNRSIRYNSVFVSFINEILKPEG